MKKLNMALAVLSMVSGFSVQAGLPKKIYGICRNDESYFQHLDSVTSPIGKTYAGKEVFLHLKLYLGPNQNYFAIYFEDITEGSADSKSVQSIARVELKGKYYFDENGNLIVEGLGIGLPSDDSNFMDFKFMTAPGDLGVKGKTIQIDTLRFGGTCFKKAIFNN